MTERGWGSALVDGGAASRLAAKQHIGYRAHDEGRHQREEGQIGRLGLPWPYKHQQGHDDRVQGMEKTGSASGLLEPGENGKQEQQRVEPHDVDVG